MTAAIHSTTIRVAVLGNPNTGKSTLFNSLTGSTQRTANYPGVTVERRTGQLCIEGQRLELIDLPGTYSLAPRAPDELVTVQVLLGQLPGERLPDLILCVVDASNLERNLFLVSQLLDLNLPLVVALNMVDLANRKGWEIDIQVLQEILGVPVVPIQAHKQIGLDSLRQALVAEISHPPRVRHDPFSQQVNERISQLDQACPDDCPLKRFVVTRLLFDADGLMTSELRALVGPAVIERLPVEQQRMAETTGVSLAEQEPHGRYAWIKSHSARFLRRPASAVQTWTTRLDCLLTHPWAGILVAIVVLAALFQIIFIAAEPASQWIETLKGVLTVGVEAVMPDGALRSLIVMGLINGVGNVLVFLPQIMLLFLILGWLEDSGYLARATYLADRILSRVGLSGLSVIPLLSSFACAIPGIMATRVIDNYRDRMVTILIAPLMSCAARLPVYILLIVAFVPDQRFLNGWLGLQGLCLLAMYLVGTLTAVIVAWVLRKFVFPGKSSTFLIELPSYKWPQWRVVWRRTWEGGKSFVQGAGTTIVAVSIVVWALAYFPRSAETVPEQIRHNLASLELRLAESELSDEQRAMVEDEKQILDNQVAALYLESSVLGRVGKWIEPAVRPLGWDWRIGSAVIASFPAREVVVSTFGIIFGLGEDVDEHSESLRGALTAARWPDDQRPLITLPVALGLLVFFALCAQCASTLAVIRRETRSWKWPLVTFVYMTALAYGGAWVTVSLTATWWG
ncbi:MAG TPA: ferrous iron transport protein B [Pirellulaceae bacterium]|mgnify:CR=1 FL=1|nr:ferrous iron transport protein B [Pirellulaceae bacterium]